jgi:hypothetical protein
LLNHFSPLNRKDSSRYRLWRKFDFQDPGVPKIESDKTFQNSKKNTQNPTADGKFKKTKYHAFGKCCVNPLNTKKIGSRKIRNAQEFKKNLKKPMEYLLLLLVVWIMFLFQNWSKLFISTRVFFMKFQKKQYL